MADSLLVDISDALSERDRIRFTVHTRTKLPQFVKPVLSVVRQHEEFIWLHECLVENDRYAGYIIPPPPPKPDFDASREKLQRLGDCEASLTKEEFAKMKQELEAEYLAIFKKTVAMHEMFLQRLASHEKFREDNNFKIFLEYENELAVRGNNPREKLAGSIQNIGKSLSDFVINTSQITSSNSNKSNYNNSHGTNNNNNSPSNNHTSSNNNNNSDYDEQYFEKERLFLALYYNSIRETANMSNKVTQAHKCVADGYLQIARQLVLTEQNMAHVSEYLEQARKIEARIASDEDLKLTDTFLYYKRDTQAAQELLMRRLRFKSEYENATKNLEKARAKGRTAMQYADVIQKQAKENYLSISKLAKKELIDYKQRRVASFRKAFTDLAELEIKHLRSHSQLILNCLNICGGISTGEPMQAVSTTTPSLAAPSTSITTMITAVPTATTAKTATISTSSNVSSSSPSSSADVVGANTAPTMSEPAQAVVNIDAGSSNGKTDEFSTTRSKAAAAAISALAPATNCENVGRDSGDSPAITTTTSATSTTITANIGSGGAPQLNS